MIKATNSKGMTDKCINPPTGIILRPTAVRGISTVTQSYPPFTLYGSPLPPIIEGITGINIKSRKTGADIPTSTVSDIDETAYLIDNNYENNILTSSTVISNFYDTTLRFKNQTYNLYFISLNAPLWEGGGETAVKSKPELNLLFVSYDENQRIKFFHMCIPIRQYTKESHKNPFITSWFNKTAVSPAGLTVNDLLNFRGHETAVDFNLMEFCLDYNISGEGIGIKARYKRPKITSVYNLCIFETPLYADLNRITNILSNSSPTLKINKDIILDFNALFNIIFKNMIPYYTRTTPSIIDYNLISTEQHFGTQTQNSISPAFYTATTTLLSGTAYTADQLKDGKRGLQNVKCYPIDLANQIDDAGNIYIDESNNNPEDPKSVLRDSKVSESTDSQYDADIQYKSAVKKRKRNIAVFIILTILLAIIVFIIAGYIAYYVLKPSDLTAPPTAVAAAAVAAVAPAAAMAASAASAASAAAGFPNTSEQNRTRQNAMSPTNAATVGIIAALASSSPP